MPAIELPVSGEGHVIDVEIEPHSNGVGRDDVIDEAVLKHIDLGIAGARRQRAKDDRRAAVLASHPFGDRINILGGKGDNGAAPGQAGHFLLARETQSGEPGAGNDPGARQEAAHCQLHGGRANQQRLLAPAQIEQAVGEDMAPVEIGRELNFIHRDESKVEIARHCLDGRNPIARRGRFDFLFARDERDRVGARPFHRAVVDLAREQPQRQANHATGMGQHPLDRVMGFAGIGRPKQDRDAPGALPRKRCGGRKWNVHGLTGAQGGSEAAREGSADSG